MIWLTCESINDPPREAETIGRFAPHGGKIEQKQFAALFKHPPIIPQAESQKDINLSNWHHLLNHHLHQKPTGTPWSKPKKSL